MKKRKRGREREKERENNNSFHGQPRLFIRLSIAREPALRFRYINIEYFKPFRSARYNARCDASRRNIPVPAETDKYGLIYVGV